MAALATSALAAAFSSADKFVFLSISANLASVVVWMASKAFSLPSGFTDLIAVSPFACAAFTASCVSAFWIASTASVAAFATSAFAAAFSSSDNLVLLSISCSFAAFSALIAVIAASFSIANFPLSFAELIPSSVVALSIASVAAFASLATFAFSSAFCSGVKLVLASIASVAFFAASAISFLAPSLSSSFNNSAALSKAVFAASTFAWAAFTSSFVALLPFAKTLAASNCAFNSSNSASYALILSAVLPVVSAFFNASEFVFNFVFSSVVAASTRRFFAVSNSVFTASTFAWAALTSSFVALLPFAKTLSASAFAASNCAFNSSYFLSYAAILSGVLPVSSAFVNKSAADFNLAFSSAVAASTKTCFAVSNADFFSLTLFKASVTWVCVAFSSLITVSASLIASCAAVFASLYAFALSAVFPCVGSASVTKVLNASFAFVNSVLSALFTNNSAAFVNSAFAASTFSWAAWASALDALFSFANTAAASVFAASNCALIASYFVL